MGCKCSKGVDDILDVNMEWRERNLPNDFCNQFENESEIKLFKTINLIRMEPKWAIPHIMNLRQHSQYTGANLEIVISKLKSMQPLPQLEVSTQALEACRKVNETIKPNQYPNCKQIRKIYKELYLKHSSQINHTEKSENNGAILRVNTIESELTNHTQLNSQRLHDHSQRENKSVLSESFINKEEPFYENSKIGWDGSCEELVMFMMIEDSQCHGDSEDLPILSDKVNKIGISFRPHQEYKSTLQILYITQNYQNALV